MIEINLLPEELRKKRIKFIKSDKTFFLIGACLAGTLVILILGINLLICINFRSSRILKEKLEFLKQEAKEAELLSQELSSFKQKLRIIDELMRRRFLWSKKLNELSNLVSPGVWLTEFFFDPQQLMRISGSVVSKKGEEMAFVARFMKNLEGDVSFFGDFKEIELEGIQRRSVQGREVVDFTLVLK